MSIEENAGAEALPLDYVDAVEGPKTKPEYRVGYQPKLVVDALEKMVAGFDLPEAILNEEVDLDPLAERVLDAYELLRADFPFAGRDKQIMSLVLQGFKTEQILEKIGDDNFLDKAGDKSDRPIKQINNIKHDFPKVFHRERRYGPESLAGMFSRFAVTGDPESFVLPATRRRSGSKVAGSLPDASAEERKHMERWLAVGLASKLSEIQLRSLGGALLGVHLEDVARANARRATEALQVSLEQASQYTHEKTEPMYSREEYRNALTYRPSEAEKILGLISSIRGEGDSNVYTEVVLAGMGARVYEKVIQKRRTEVIRAVARIMAIVSDDVPTTPRT